MDILLIGDIEDVEKKAVKRILSVDPGSRIDFYINSGGGSLLSALSLTTVMRMRKVDGMAYVLGDCSSAMLYPFAACQVRKVSPFSTFLFHPGKYDGDSVAVDSAVSWAKWCGWIEREADNYLAALFGVPRETIENWSGQYVTGPQLAEAGLAEIIQG